MSEDTTPGRRSRTKSRAGGGGAEARVGASDLGQPTTSVPHSARAGHRHEHHAEHREGCGTGAVLSLIARDVSAEECACMAVPIRVDI